LKDVEEVPEWGRKKERLSWIAGCGGKKGRGAGGVGDEEMEAFFSSPAAEAFFPTKNSSSYARCQLKTFPLSCVAN
jgi:hypothetical protein